MVCEVCVTVRSHDGLKGSHKLTHPIGIANAETKVKRRYRKSNPGTLKLGVKLS